MLSLIFYDQLFNNTSVNIELFEYKWLSYVQVSTFEIKYLI